MRFKGLYTGGNVNVFIDITTDAYVAMHDLFFASLNNDSDIACTTNGTFFI